MNTAAYLARLGLTEADVAQDASFLCKLQYAHVTCVPYENLDITDGIPLSLDAEALFEKLVTRGRGGYCFEVNGALCALLTALGFTVKSRLARFWRGETAIPMRRHRVLIVSLPDGDYLCDVGIGQSAPRHPLKLSEGLEQAQFGEVYCIRKDAQWGHMVYDLHEGEWRAFYSFGDEDEAESDFIMPSFWCERHRDSPFRKAPMVAMKTEKGRLAINGRDYKEFEGDRLVYIEENVNDERLEALLRERFGIVRK